jgi:hypothetical protein
MRTFTSPYDFYKLPQRDRKHLIDQCYVVEHDAKTKARIKNGETAPQQTLYFPIGLTKYGSYDNYNLCVNAFSPDDYDLGLFYHDPATGLREQIIAFGKTAPKRETTYKEFLQKIHDRFGGRWV